MTWLPKSNYTNELYSYLEEVSDNLCKKNKPMADSYYALLVRASGTLTALQADYNNFSLTKQIPNINIQTKGIPQTPQMTVPKQITLAKCESSAPKQKENITCIVCGGSHLAHRCVQTRKIRYREIIPPNQFCSKHCGKKGEACKDNNSDKCYIFRKQNGSLIDLTCGQRDHRLRHFLLCEAESCPKKIRSILEL